MSKKILVLCLSLGVLASSNAFASRARNLVMGTGDAGTFLGTSGGSGSFYFNDNYNVFYNPAYVNDFKNWGIIEKSNNPGNTAMGGFVTSAGPVNFGAYFNRVEGINGAYTGGNNNMRPIDLMVGGDMMVKWGVGATMASQKVGDKSDSETTLKVGASYMDIEPFAHFTLTGSNKLAGETEVKNTRTTVGVRYHWGEWVPFAAYTTAKTADVTVNKAWGLGVGRSAKVAEGATMSYSLGYFGNNTFAPGVRHIVPINFAVEGEALSWLTLRAGLGYNLSDVTGGASAADNTFGRVGATMHVGKVNFDFAVGTGQGAGDVGSEANKYQARKPDETTANLTGRNTYDTQTMGLSPGFFTAASVAYNW